MNELDIEWTLEYTHTNPENYNKKHVEMIGLEQERIMWTLDKMWLYLSIPSIHVNYFKKKK